MGGFSGQNLLNQYSPDVLLPILKHRSLISNYLICEL